MQESGKSCGKVPQPLLLLKPRGGAAAGLKFERDLPKGLYDAVFCFEVRALGHRVPFKNLNNRIFERDNPSRLEEAMMVKIALATIVAVPVAIVANQIIFKFLAAEVAGVFIGRLLRAVAQF